MFPKTPIQIQRFYTSIKFTLQNLEYCNVLQVKSDALQRAVSSMFKHTVFDDLHIKLLKKHGRGRLLNET